MIQHRRGRFRLHTKIIAWSFIPTAIILLLVATTMYFAYQQVTGELVLKRDEELTRLSATELSANFADFTDALTTVASTPEIYDGFPAQQRASLASFKNRLVLFDGGVYLVDNLGIVVAALPEHPEIIGQDWSNQRYYQDMARSPAPLFSDIVDDGPDGRKVVVLAVPVSGTNGTFRGAVLGMFQLEASTVSPLYGTIIKLRIGGSGSSFIIDRNQRVVYSSDFNQIGTQFTRYPTTLVAEGQVGVTVTRTADNHRIVAGFAPVPRSQWTLVIEEDWNELLRSGQGYQRYLVLLLIAGIVIPTIVVTIGVRRIDGPIANFISAAKRISNGEFNQPITVRTGDELEVLADQFNIMAARLSESYETLESRVAARTQELTALNSIASIVSRSLNLDEILPDALRKTIEILGMDAGAVFRVEEGKDTLTLVTQQGMDDQIGVIENIPVEQSLISEVLKTGRPAARPVTDYAPGPLREVFDRSGWKLAVSIPLVAQEKVLGAINMASRSASPPTPEELAVPAAIGQQIGVAIENARLYEQTVEYAHEMEAARSVAEAANLSKSNFLANVSHELRTPLVSILGFARIAQKRLEERVFPAISDGDVRLQHAQAQVEENLRIILTEGQRLTELINALLDLEKIEAGKMEWDIRPLQIADVISQAVSATASLLIEKKLALVQKVPDHLPLVEGDRAKLMQVVINLVSNAVKFTREGTITIQAHASPEEVIVQVIDQGIGIAPADQDMLFEKFTQVGDPLTEKPKGTGLGLAISKEIIQHHAGRIWVESELGKGSIFSFALPLLKEAEQATDGVDARAKAK